MPVSRTIVSVFLLVQFSYLFAQQRSNDWVLGGWGATAYFPSAPGNEIDFLQGFADTINILKRMPFFITNSSIADSTGKVLFYTNGIYISNRNHDTLWNSTNFNPGAMTDFYEPGGLGNTQAAIAIPKPGSKSEYLLFHLSGELIVYHGTGPYYYPLQLSYSQVDMTFDNGLGGVDSLIKNVPVLFDTLYRGQITACKHANGRDWWIVVKKYLSDRFYKILVNPEGIQSVTSQEIGNQVGNGTILGMALFSPDGSKYAFTHVLDTIEFMQFDRCSGEFSDYEILTVPYTTPNLYWSLGCSFSPNSRYLYANTYKELFQFDTWASDIQTSVVKVADWDTLDPNLNYFFLEQLAPDGRIYISTFNSLEFKMYYIDQPDSAGMACNFNQVGISLNSPSNSLPNLPNYDLGPLAGSGCDTIVNIPTNATEIKKSSFRITPNPVFDWLNIIYQSPDDALFELFNINGHCVAAISLYHYFKNCLINVSSLPAGIYLAAVTVNGKKVWNEKVVVER